MNACILVPHYNHLAQFERFLPDLMLSGLPLIVVDDGSEPAQCEGLEKLLSEHSKHDLVDHLVYHLVCHESNRGKGVAFMSGLHKAAELGFSHAIQIDADGQHETSSIPAMLDCSVQQPSAIVSGLPMFDESIPPVRLWGRKITLYLSRVEAMSAQIQDAMCGFRVYPVDDILALSKKYSIGQGMDFDADILVKAVWFGLPVLYIPTPVVYQENGVSHFHYFRDNLVMIGLHTRLLIGAILRAPKLIYQSLVAKQQ